MRFSLCILALLIAGCASQSTDRSSRATTAGVSTTGAPPTVKTETTEKVICRYEEVTNTRLKSRKICLTEEGWAARADSAGEAFKSMKNNIPKPTRE